MKRRLLILGAAASLLGALALGGALSFENVTSTVTTGVVDVQDTAVPSITLQNSVSQIPANGDYHQTDDIYADVDDTTNAYVYTLTRLEITNAGHVEHDSCGEFDYSLNDTGTDVDNDEIQLDNNPGGQDVGDVYLRISPIGTNNACQVEGAVITATFTIGGPVS